MASDLQLHGISLARLLLASVVWLLLFHSAIAASAAKPAKKPQQGHHGVQQHKTPDRVHKQGKSAHPHDGKKTQQVTRPPPKAKGKKGKATHSVLPKSGNLVGHKSDDHSSSGPPASAMLSNNYYSQSCPQVEGIIRQKVAQWVDKDITLAASLLRLHFHDCIVTGCDASILLNSGRHHDTERDSVFSKGLRGFEVIDDIKIALEAQCPGIVSCADILTTVARDVVLEVGGPFWFVPFGRKDSLVSHIADAAKVPGPDEDANSLLKLFNSLGLNVVDLVALSAAHTIGSAHCFAFEDRLGSTPPDPRLNTTYAQFLRNKCKGGPMAKAFNDPITPFVFDSQYFENVEQKMGLFRSDESLYYDNDITRSLMDTFKQQPELFMSQFANSMVNLGNVDVLVGPDLGEVRHDCNVRNSRWFRRRNH